MAQLNLGMMYEQGFRIPKNKVIAYKWYKMAQKNGTDDAILKMTSIAKKMTSQQIQDAEKLAEKWELNKLKIQE
ncbi:MAG: SEL1-like repeat protein [Halopseudomonas aestusnigri]